MDVSKLHEKASTLYEYITVKESVTTYMQVRPQKLLLEKHVDGLGFELMDRGEKNAKILLKSKEKNLQQVLMLSYYSMPLSSIFIPEGFVALFMSNNMKKDKSPFALDSLYQMMASFADMLKNEHLFDHEITRDRTQKRVQFFVDRRLAELSKDNREIWLSDGALPILEFFKSLVLPLVDTYLIVLVTIDQLCGKNIVLK